MKFKNNNFLSQTGTSWHPYEAHMGTPGEFSTKSQQLFLFSLHPFCLHPYAKHICCLSSAFFLSSSFKPPLLFLLFSSTLYLCCTFQTFPPSLPIFSLYFRIFLYFSFLFLIALLCLSHFTLPTGQSLIFSNRVYANSQDENRVSAGLSRGHALLTHTYIDSYTLRTLHTHTHLCAVLVRILSSISCDSLWILKTSGKSLLSSVTSKINPFWHTYQVSKSHSHC